MKYIIMIILLTNISLAYDAPDRNSVDFVLEGGYTAPDRNSVNFVLGEVIGDSCTCPGLDNDFNIDLSDFCIISDDCDIGTGRLNFSKSGNFTCAATITFTTVGGLGDGNIGYIKGSDCHMRQHGS